MIGGTTALSGGVCWLPCNHLAAEAGLHDSREDALAYLRSLSHGMISEDLAEALVDGTPKVLEFLETKTPLRFQLLPIPDYHAERPGGKPRGGRSIEPTTTAFDELGDWGPRIFLSVFVLIGFGFVCAALYQLLAIFNPRPVLTVSAAAVPLGGATGVRWRFTGNVRRIAKLTISLMAREEATYRRGTSTTTDRILFVNAVLLDSADHAQFASGSVKVEIPRDSIHTFTAPNNKIVWLLRVHADIPKWPDVNAEFPITVLPRDPATLFHEQPPAI